MHEIRISAGSAGEGVHYILVVALALDCLALPVLSPDCRRDHNGDY